MTTFPERVKKLQTAGDTYRHRDMTIDLNLNIIYGDYAVIIAWSFDPTVRESGMEHLM